MVSRKRWVCTVTDRADASCVFIVLMSSVILTTPILPSLPFSRTHVHSVLAFFFLMFCLYCSFAAFVMRGETGGDQVLGGGVDIGQGEQVF